MGFTEKEMELIRKEKAEYMREWRRKNKERARANDNRSVLRKALKKQKMEGDVNEA